MLAGRPRPKAARNENAARDAGGLQGGGPHGTLARAKIAARRHLVEFVRDEDGGPLVEFTILTPLIFLLMFGIVEWGNIYFIKNSMFIAARLAARQAAVGSISGTSGVGAGAVAAACASPSPIHGTAYTYTFTFAYNRGCAAASTPTDPTYGTVTMTISTPAATVATFNYSNLIGGNLSASATMQQEYTCPAAAGSYSVSQQC